MVPAKPGSRGIASGPRAGLLARLRPGRLELARGCRRARGQGNRSWWPRRELEALARDLAREEGKKAGLRPIVRADVYISA